MKAGNLDNKLAPSLGVRFEGLIYLHGTLNQSAKAFLENITADSVNVFLITTLPERKAMSFCYKWAIPYTRIIEVDSTLEIPEICIAHEMLMYYDTDDKVLENIGNRGKIPTKGMKWILAEDTSQQLSTKTDLMKQLDLE